MVYRNQNKGYIAGVAAGIAEAYSVPVTMVRLLFILTSFFLGLGILVYLYLILIMDEHSGQTRLHFQ